MEAAIEALIKELTDSKSLYTRYGTFWSDTIDSFNSLEQSYKDGESPTEGAILERARLLQNQIDADNINSHLFDFFSAHMTAVVELMIQNNQNLIKLIHLLYSKE